MVIGVTAQKKIVNQNETKLFRGDPLEKSAFLKKDLPWFARFQVGEPPVVGFPGETSEEKKERMRKWADAKYGLFLHWGPQRKGGEYIIPDTVLENFNPTNFNAEKWVLTAKRLGFKYIVITAKHHAGFSMYDSKLTDYDIIEKTPFKRDPIKELADACAEQEMPFGVYYSVWDMYQPTYSKDIGSAEYAKYHEFMLGQVEELLTNYGPMISVWFDGEWVNSWTVERATEFRDKIREIQPNTVIANRIGQRRKGEGAHHSPENFMPYIGNQNDYWESCAKFDGGWFYSGTEKSKSPEWALYSLCYAASRGGNFLMNLGPTPKGEFLETSVKKLEKVGDWLQTNGESIYEAQKGPHYFLEWGTSTRKGNTLYYQIFDWPENGKLMIPGLVTEVESACFLADTMNTYLRVTRKNGNVYITIPKSPPYKMANVIKVELEGTPKVDHAIRVFHKELLAKDAMRAVPAGGYFFSVGFANIQGETLHFAYGTGAGAQRENLKGWTEENDLAEWDLLVEKDGSYNVEITYGSLVDGGVFELTIADKTFQHTVKAIPLHPKAKESPLIVKYNTLVLGDVTLKPGRYKMTIKPLKIDNEAKRLHQGLMTLRDVTLVPR
ncbi:alpha-L-fucosidase [Cellulophaga sp. L1A9]|uniref:alpha-L-fucosidase n=1 Tax=Cellulophaga sp. L1A9 TaxID=2686362 RepID=UPI00131BE85E|nr:alpha-L-fucosidase [Cellulophaga sp. L1A9]